ncbi:MAG: sulfotransferase family protein, partial [Solirubrobacteraceae bacterium]
MLPTFLIIGAQKAASTALWRMLTEHPDVFIPEMKETDFLLGTDQSGRGRAWYESLYEAAGEARHRGDASPSYSMFPFFRGVPERAAELVPEARIIYIIRHPVKRMISHWMNATSIGNEYRTIE